MIQFIFLLLMGVVCVTATDDQQWTLIIGYNDSAVTIAKDGGLILQSITGEENQLWKFQERLLVSKAGLVADINHCIHSPGVQVQTWPRHGGENQRFTFVNNSIIRDAYNLVFEASENKEVIMASRNEESTMQSFLLWTPPDLDNFDNLLQEQIDYVANLTSSNPVIQKLLDDVKSNLIGLFELLFPSNSARKKRSFDCKREYLKYKHLLQIETRIQSSKKSLKKFMVQAESYGFMNDDLRTDFGEILRVHIWKLQHNSKDIGQLKSKIDDLNCEETTSVSCGNHFASSCGECPGDFGILWCNGECHWQDGQCKAKGGPGEG